MKRPLVAALFVLAPLACDAASLVVLTRDKVAAFRTAEQRGVVRVGRDRAFATLLDPTCPGTASVQLASYPQATNLVVSQPEVTLDCTRWRARNGGWVWESGAGATGGVRRVIYRRDRLVVTFDGPGFAPVAGPVGYVELWFTVDGVRHLARFHNFRDNDAARVVTRRPSKAAADGEQAFWDVLHGDDRSETRQQDTLRDLERAAKHDRKDGRSRFLAAMMHLYRFGQTTASYVGVSDEARAEIEAASAGFDAAVPFLWNAATQRGDSRVPGFAAAAKFTLGYVRGDQTLVDQGLADLAAAVAINPIFNIFDYIPIAQAVAATDPRFALVLAQVDGAFQAGLASCVGTQPEICNNFGLAPRNIEGSLALFGDLYAKGGRLADAQRWYAIASGVAAGTPAPYRFQAILDDRAAHAAERVGLYQDADPGNDPVIIGAAEEACATCHNR